MDGRAVRGALVPVTSVPPGDGAALPGRLAGKVAVVTGGASGLGEGIVRRLVAEGAQCVVADLQDGPGEALADELGDAARFRRADVAEEDDVADLVDGAVRDFGRLDCMFNNAGILGVVGPIASTSREAWDRTLAVLLTSVFLGVKHAGRVMATQGSGSIVNTASTAGVHGGLGPHAYTAAKHAVVGLTRSAAVELARSGVRVNALAPGATVSAMTANVLAGDPDALEEAARSMAARAAMGRAATAADVAAAAAFLAGEESWFVNGHCLVLDGTNEVLGQAAWKFFSQDASLVQERGRTS